MAKLMPLIKHLTAATLLVPIACLVVLVMLPIYWMSITSIKPFGEICDMSHPLWVQNPTLTHYRYVLHHGAFLGWALHSLLLGAMSSALTLVVAMPYAYYTARIATDRVRNILKGAILLCYLTPSVFLAISLKVWLGAVFDASEYALAMAYPILQFPINVWILDAAIRRVPRELDEYVVVDGGGWWTVLRHAIFPSIPRAIIAVLAFSWWIAWCDYAFALLLGSPRHCNTITTGLASLHTGDAFEWGQLMAAGVLMLLFTLPFCITGLWLGIRIVRGSEY